MTKDEANASPKDAALHLALKAMESFQNGTNGLYEGEFEEEITAIKAALEAKDEPVAWVDRTCLKNLSDDFEPTIGKKPVSEYDIPLYTTPPQLKPLVFGLNDDGQFTFSVGVQTFTLDYFPENDEETEFMKRQLTHAIEAAHGIKGEA